MFAAWYHRPLILSSITYAGLEYQNLKYQMLKSIGCKDIEFRKLQLVTYKQPIPVFVCSIDTKPGFKGLSQHSIKTSFWWIWDAA